MKGFLTAVGCLLFLVCQSQELLPRIGFAMNTGTFPNAVAPFDVSFTPGFLTGIDLRLGINDQFGITAELLFVQKGYRIDYELDADPQYDKYYEKMRVNYADLLVLPTYKWLNLYFMAGPGLSYGLFGNTYMALTDFNGGVSTRTLKIYFKEQEPGTPSYRYIDNRLALTGTAAVGITLWELLLVDVRYQFSPTRYPYQVPHDNRAWYHSVQLTTALRIRRD